MTRTRLVEDRLNPLEKFCEKTIVTSLPPSEQLSLTARFPICPGQTSERLEDSNSVRLPLVALEKTEGAPQSFEKLPPKKGVAVYVSPPTRTKCQILFPAVASSPPLNAFKNSI